MPTLNEIVTAIDAIIQDDSYDLETKVNDAVNDIAGGIIMPDKSISPPLPDLFTYESVNTSTTLPYVSMPTNYQRGLLRVYDSSKDQIIPPIGGNYNSFALFLKQVPYLDLSETGSVYKVCIKGNKIYYQGIPSASVALGLHYYRKPVAMALDDDVPDGLPDFLAKRLIIHYVCKETFGEGLEDGQDNVGVGVKYHTNKFYELMAALIGHIPIDAEPQYYGSDDFIDAGICD
jgi:hypothetical protein